MVTAKLLLELDHLVYATPDLEATCRDLEDRLGVRATPGGQHPGRGTHNALIAIGDRSYLEIIGPDPLQPDITPEWFGINKLTSPKMVTWAIRRTELENLSISANIGATRSGSRRTPSGTTLSWQLTEPQIVNGIGLIPFLIEWHSNDHPALNAAPGPRLVQLRIEHPDQQSISRQLETLELAVEVSEAASPGLIAIFAGSNKLIELR